MAKFNVEVEVDWLEEGETIDELIKSEILHKVSKAVEERLQKSALEKFDAKVLECVGQIETRVTELSNKVIDDFVTNQRFPVPTSSYDKNPPMKTILEIFTSKLDASLQQKVDRDGCKTDYGAVGTRIDWLVGKLAEKHADEKVKAHVKDIKAHIEKYILDKVKGEIMTQLSESVLQKIDFSKIK